MRCVAAYRRRCASRGVCASRSKSRDRTQRESMRVGAWAWFCVGSRTLTSSNDTGCSRTDSCERTVVSLMCTTCSCTVPSTDPETRIDATPGRTPGTPTPCGNTRTVAIEASEIVSVISRTQFVESRVSKPGPLRSDVAVSKMAPSNGTGIGALEGGSPEADSAKSEDPRRRRQPKKPSRESIRRTRPKGTYILCDPSAYATTT